MLGWLHWEAQTGYGPLRLPFLFIWTVGPLGTETLVVVPVTSGGSLVSHLRPVVARVPRKQTEVEKHEMNHVVDIPSVH